MTTALSCANCWYNPLQSGSLGSSYGYCVEHNILLRRPDETTCVLQMRKDLLLPTARAEQEMHEKELGPGMDLKIVRGEAIEEPDVFFTDPDVSMNGDRVARLVKEYGEYGTKIESLAQLRITTGARAETAMLNLARGYTSRCVIRGGSWTSGLHLLWWTRQRMEFDLVPDIAIDDLRYQLPVPLDRQKEIVQWSLLMLRLIFISDVATHANSSKERIVELETMAEDAAADTGIVSLRKVRSWVKREAIPRFDRVLSESRYRELAQELSQPT